MRITFCGCGCLLFLPSTMKAMSSGYETIAKKSEQTVIRTITPLGILDGCITVALTKLKQILRLLHWCCTHLSLFVCSSNLWHTQCTQWRDCQHPAPHHKTPMVISNLMSYLFALSLLASVCLLTYSLILSVKTPKVTFSCNVRLWNWNQCQHTKHGWKNWKRGKACSIF